MHKKTIEDIIKTFNVDQLEMFEMLKNNDRYQFRVPTGVGKGYVMIAHILYTIIKTKQSKFLISSHRLSLNNQHLKDLIGFYIDLNLINKVKFLTVGSQALNISKVLADDYDLAKKFNNQLFEYNFSLDMKSKMNQDDIFKFTLSKKEVNKIIAKNDKEGFKTIIITTYNSSDKVKDQKIDISYFDEAHILASDKEDSDFRNSFNMINSKKNFFFTATPKDVEEQMIKDGESSDIFLMNNKEIFGDIYEIKFKHCVKKAYITSLVTHVAYPKDIGEGKDYNSIDNKSIFVKEAFDAHGKWLKGNSSSPDEIEPKMLVRCESVPHMWEMYNMLSSIVGDDIIVCAGASYNESGPENHVISDEWIKNRDEFIKKIQNFNSKQKMIILQFDILSEGLNVPGITGVMFLQGKMPSTTKVIQNVGRATRLHHIDRIEVRKGKLKYGESGWIKPKCAVIIPYWDEASEFTKRILASKVRELRDSWEFDPHLVLSVGDDLADGDEKNDVEGLNKLEKSDKRTKLIKELKQEIEELDLLEEDFKERERLQGLSDIEFFNELNKK